MMRRKTRRLWLVGACGVGLCSATALGLTAFSSSLVFFMGPSQIEAQHPPPDRLVRLGGMVQAGTVRLVSVGGQSTAAFRVTDGQASVEVHYVGVLPDLFRQGQGIVTVGTLQPDGVFRAQQVLAKHSADYMPKDVEQTLRATGKWNPAFGPPPSASTWNMMGGDTMQVSAKTAGAGKG